MALEASVLTVQVVSQGITDATKALNDLAAAGEKAEKGTSNIGKGASAVGQAAKDAAQAGVDAAQKAQSQYNAIIDKMTEDAKAFYAAESAMKQQEAMDSAVLVDKLNGMLLGYFQNRAEQREKDKQATLQSQQDAMAAATERYNKEIELMNKQFDAFQSNRAKQEAAAQAKGDALNMAGTRANDYAKLQADIKALKDETDKLAAAEKAEQSQREAIDMMAQKKRWQDEAAAVREATAAKVAAEKAEQQLKADGDAFVAMLKRQAETVGMTTKELREYNAEQLRTKAAQLGVSQQVEQHIQTLQKAKGPHESFNLLTAGSARELMVLGHELSQGSFQRFGGSLIVLAERINFLPSLLEKAGTAAAALGVSLGVLVAAVAAIVAVTAGAIYTYEKSATALKQMKQEVILTGGAIGATGDELYRMANRIGDATGEFGKSREAVIALAATGRFSADQIKLIAEAAVGLEKYAGVSVEKTAAAFERLAAEPLKASDKAFKGVSDAAMKLDQQLHFLEPTVLAHIMQLERQGDAAGASKVAIEALAQEEKKRAEQLRETLTPFGQLLDTLAEKASKFWNELFHKGTLDDQLKDLQTQLSNAIRGGQSDNYINELKTKILGVQDKILQNEYDTAAKAHTQKVNNALELGAIELRNINERAKGEETFEQRKKNYYNILNPQRDRAAKDPAYAARMADLISSEAEQRALEQIKKDSMRKEAKPKSDGLAGLNQDLAGIDARYEAERRYYVNTLKFIDDLKQKHLIADSEADHAIKETLENQAVLEEKAARESIQKVENFHSKDVKLMEEAGKKKEELKKKLDKILSDNGAKQDRTATDPAAREQAEQDKADKESQRVIGQTMEQVRAIQAKIDAYKSLPESVRAAGITEKQMQDAITQSTINWYDEKIKAVEAMGPASEKEVARLKAEKAALEQKTKAQKDWEEIEKKNNAAINQSAALTKIATEQVKMWKDTGNEIEKALKSAFGNSGEAAGKMFKAFAEGQASQIDLANQIRVVNESKSLSEQAKQKQINDLQMQGAQAQIGSYANMADAASMFFEKGSTGYQAMVKAAQVLHTAEVALSLIKGVNAILTQGEGDPYTAFARMAAMTALVAGLGVAVSGGGGVGPMSAADQQRVQGTGTVFGSSTIVNGNKVELVGAKSDSIAHSLTILEKDSGLGLSIQNDMLDAMRRLNDNITGFAKLAVQNGNLTGATAGTSFHTTGGVTGLLGALGTTFAHMLPGFIGNALGKVATAIFGGKTTTDDTGLTMGKATLGQIDQSGLSASQYTNTTTSGGWFRSDKHNTSTTSLGSDFNNQVTMVVKSMQDTLSTAAKGLGLNSAVFNDKLKNFVVDIGNVSLKGMTGDQIQQTLQNIFSKLGDQMATYAFGDLQKYQKIGEGLMETVTRVANDLTTVKKVFDILGQSIPKNVDAIATSEKMIENFGSLDNLTKGIKDYENSIYTDQEKLAPVIKDVATTMQELGVSSITTKEQFKTFVDGLDKTSDLFKKMVLLAPEFGQMVDAADKVTNDSRTALTDAYNREAQAIKDTQDKMTGFVKTLKELQKSTLLGNLSPLTPQQKYLEAKAQFDQVAKAAQGGDEDAQGKFQGAYQAFLQASQLVNASGQQYQQDFAYAQKVTQDATSWAEKQVDVAKATLDALNAQVSGMTTLNNTLLTVNDAINNLVKAQGGDAGSKANANSANAIDTLYQSLLGRHADADGTKYWMDAMSKGQSIADIAKMIGSSPEAMGQVQYVAPSAAMTQQAPTSAIAPVTAIQNAAPSQSNEKVAAILTAVKFTLDEVKSAIREGAQNTVGAIYDSQDAASDKTVDGVSTAIRSGARTSMYKIIER